MIETKLDHEDLKTLVCGATPSFDLIKHDFVKTKGKFSEDYDIWQWDMEVIEKCTDEELWELYRLCKNSKFDM